MFFCIIISALLLYGGWLLYSGAFVSKVDGIYINVNSPISLTYKSDGGKYSLSYLEIRSGETSYYVNCIGLPKQYCKDENNLTLPMSYSIRLLIRNDYNMKDVMVDRIYTNNKVIFKNNYNGYFLHTPLILRLVLFPAFLLLFKFIYSCFKRIFKIFKTPIGDL